MRLTDRDILTTLDTAGVIHNTSRFLFIIIELQTCLVILIKTVTLLFTVRQSATYLNRIDDCSCLYGILKVNITLESLRFLIIRGLFNIYDPYAHVTLERSEDVGDFSLSCIKRQSQDLYRSACIFWNIK